MLYGSAPTCRQTPCNGGRTIKSELKQVKYPTASCLGIVLSGVVAYHVVDALRYGRKLNPATVGFGIGIVPVTIVLICASIIHW